jgi:hypothetical protein
MKQRPHPQRPDADYLATRHASEFACAGPDCPDTCCRGWLIEVDKPTRKKYLSKPDLQDAFDDLPDGSSAMRCDQTSGLCLHNREGWCGIQEKYGEDFLSDTCHFYPRTYRQIGRQRYMGVSFSCPEAAYAALYGNAALERSPSPENRPVGILINRQLPGLPTETIYQLHLDVLHSLTANGAQTVEAQMAALLRLGYAIDETDSKDWANLFPFYVSTSPPAAPAAPMDEYLPDLLHGLFCLAVSDRTQYRPRLYETFRDMEKAMQLRMHWTESTMEHTPHTPAACHAISVEWQSRYAAHYAPVMRKWLQVQVANNLYPFAGLGETRSEQARFLALHFAVMRLGLICATHRAGNVLEPFEVIRVMQPIARLFDHITDADVLRRYFPHSHLRNETGMRTVIGHAAPQDPASSPANSHSSPAAPATPAQ